MTDLKERAPRSRRARNVPQKYIADECRLLEATIKRAKLATPEDIDPYRPGGKANPAVDAYGWFAFHRRLSRLHAKQDETVMGVTSALTPSMRDADDELLERAQHEESVRVDLQYPFGDTTYLLVRSLSGYALSHIDARDGIIDCLARHQTALKRSNAPSDQAIRAQLREEIAYQETVIEWCVTSEAAPGLPYRPRENPRPEVPETFEKLHTVDVTRVFAAYHRLNGASLAILRKKISIEPDAAPGSGRVGSWRTFTATLEVESNHQIPARAFWRDRALVSLLMNRYIAIEEQGRQHKAAKEKAEAEANKRKR